MDQMIKLSGKGKKGRSEGEGGEKKKGNPGGPGGSNLWPRASGLGTSWGKGAHS